MVLLSVNGTYSTLAIGANLSLNQLRTHSCSRKGASEAYGIANQLLASSRPELRKTGEWTVVSNKHSYWGNVLLIRMVRSR